MTKLLPLKLLNSFNFLRCNGDANDKYSELVKIVKGKLAVNLSLKVGGKKGDDVLIAIFFDRAADKSAICPLLVSSLNEKFDSYTGLDNRCSHNYANRGNRRSKSVALDDGVIDLEPIGTYTGRKATAILLQTIKDDNVAIIGTSTGDIMKIVLRDEVSGGIQKTDKSILATPIRQLIASDTMMYGYSGTRVFGEPLGNCQEYSTCETCAASPDPFCGWCLLKAR